MDSAPTGDVADRHLSDLIQRIAQQDQIAFRDFYDRTVSRMLGITIRMLGRRDMAEEAIQDAYVAVWHSAPRFDPNKGSALGWLTTIVRRKAIDRLRASPWLKREVQKPIDGITIELDHPEGMSLRHCLGQLDTLTRSCIYLCYLYGLTHGELSDATDTPLGTLKSRMRRGLAKLKECLDQ